MRKVSLYVLKEFLSFLWYIILAFIAIFVLVDLVENFDGFIDNKLKSGLIFLYYIFYLPYIVVLTLPVSMLLATMFSLGRLGGDNEIIAAKASGISLYRILLPLYVFSFLMGFVVMFFAESFVPRTNLYREDIMMQKNEYKFTLSRNREMDRNMVYLSNNDGRIIFARSYSSTNKIARNVFIIEQTQISTNENNNSDMKRESLLSRIDARYMIFSNEMWTLHNAVVRTFTDNGEVLEHHKTLPAPFITRKPSDFARIDLKPDEMNYFQLSKYIEKVNDMGGDASDRLVDLFLKISFPFVSFVIVFFGAPMAAGSTKRGKTASFGIALVIAFIYYSLVHACQVLGRNNALEPFTAAWLPNLLFFCVGLFMLAHAKK
ncbi:MAG: YjgP/YjgQ family permease [Candidatus Latescibacteria bacterium]|jgi:lipopolysaccharide export system permease protein|nr:YjgP/YjgQ family permease [Candidatus Latescibacterota bacterium]